MDLKHKTVGAGIAADAIKSGMTVAMSGWAMAGYPKAVPEELVRKKRAGEDLSITLLTGANVPWLDDKLGAENIISRRAPMIASRKLASGANSGSLHYVEQQMNKMPKLLRGGAFGRIDIAVIEALGFNEQGELIPGSSIGMTHHFLEAAEQIIVEINGALPAVLRQLHDIHIPAPPPYTQPIPLTMVGQRIGRPGLKIDPEKISYIVKTEIPERLESVFSGTELTNRIASRLFDFLRREYGARNGKLPPVQLGFGSIADSIALEFENSEFKDLEFFCGGVTEPVINLLASGKAAAVSAGGIGMSERVERILNETPRLKERLVVRNGDITNSAEVINRLGLVSLNTGIEIDIYGNVNSSHITGNRIVNGIGGGAGFAQNAGLSVILLPSTAKGGAVSCIVPMVPHVDICEHDIDIVVTENGIADLRGLDEVERAEAVIANCASELYKDSLFSYLTDARQKGGHHPQIPDQAFAWYKRLSENGSMLEKEQ